MQRVTPEQFIKKWKTSTLKESASAKSHFDDLCRLLELPTPTDADPHGTFYTFEKHVTRATGRKGFADVWKRGAFGWEYKGKFKDLNEAYNQLLAYRDDLENPPLSVVCDFEQIVIHTNFINTAKITEVFTLEDLRDDAKRERLKQVWLEPQAFNPTKLNDAVTKVVINDLVRVADNLKLRGENPDAVAHFLVRCVFTFFAEDVGLLPKDAFSRIIEASHDHPEDFRAMTSQLFALMKTGGVSIVGRIRHFNGGVFDSEDAPALGVVDLKYLAAASRQDWRALNPGIFGTLFERIIDPNRRAQLGAHYTEVADINDVIEPVILAPLRAEWDAVREAVAPLIQAANTAVPDASLFSTANPAVQSARAEAIAKLEVFQTRLTHATVLDPAMGSGNFLYVTLRRLLDLESEVRATLRLLEPGKTFTVRVHPSQMRGIEISPYAHEIAGMVLWVGYLQWMREHGEALTHEPVLERLANLENRDAVLDAKTGIAPAFPPAEFIVGNPPFLGNYKMRSEFGDAYTEALRLAYKDSVPGSADFVCYWFEQARSQIAAGATKRAGLIATNSIRQKLNRPVLERILATGGIFMAWSDRAWVQDGAAVRVSIVSFDGGSEQARVLDGHAVEQINADLSGNSFDPEQIKALSDNAGKAFKGVMPAGPFDLTEETAKLWLELPNPSGVSNRDVLRPYVSGEDIMKKPASRWIIDFALMSEAVACEYLVPYQHVLQSVKPERMKNNRKTYRDRWWLAAEPRPGMRSALKSLARYIATSRVAKHRVFVWLPIEAIPSNSLTVIAADDDYTYGVVNSTAHTAWVTRVSGWMGIGNDSQYTNESFETFPFPRPSDAQRDAIASAAKYLETCRTHLKSHGRTLTEMYNALSALRDLNAPDPTHEAYSLLTAHDALDKAVHAAYGWAHPMTTDAILETLLELNLERAAAQTVVAGSSV